MADEAHLESLAVRFMSALERRRNGDIDRALKDLRAILKVEPRLAEPHMELASLLLSTEQPEPAVEHAREALRLLQTGGQWTDEVPEQVINSLAWNLLGESLKQMADQDSVVFGSPERWNRLMTEAKAAFNRAAELDPNNQHASWSAFGFGPEPEPLDDDDDVNAGIPALDLVGLVAMYEGKEVD
jgi:tetratricopeptide (TPR) repeat protein